MRRQDTRGNKTGAQAMKTPLVMSLMLSLLILSLWIQPVLGQVLAPAPVLSFQNTWGGNDLDSAEGVAVAPDGSIYVVGRTRSFSANNVDFDVFLVKYAPNGTLLFQQTYGTAGGSEDGNAVAVGPDGSVYVAGTSADTKALLVKFAPNGTLIWQRTWGGTPGGEFANGVAVSGDGASVYITGGTGSFGAGFDDALLVKFDANGALVWQKT